MPDPAFRPLTPAALAEVLAGACLARDAPGPALRVAVDGADAARPGELADATAALLTARGRPCARVSMLDWWRPASLRLEHGRDDAESYRTAWFDRDALVREVLDPLGPGGDGRWLPTLRDPVADRSTRASRRACAPGTVLLVDGPMLLGTGLPLDLGLHVHLSPAALHRRTPPEQHWTLPALLEHEELTGTDGAADLLVRAEHADRPALRTG